MHMRMVLVAAVARVEVIGRSIQEIRCVARNREAARCLAASAASRKDQG
jgi:hypothetical protein